MEMRIFYLKDPLSENKMTLALGGDKEGGRPWKVS
jgi:hypothetical protein